MADKKRLERLRLVVAATLVVTTALATSVLANAVAGNRGVASPWSSSAWAVAGVVVGLLSAVLSVLLARRSEAMARTKERGISDRADEARDHLSAAARLLDELGAELAARIRLLEQHQVDAERYEQLASLNAEQAKAIEGLVGRQFERQSRVTWMQFGASLLAAFLLGLVVNWISQPALAWLTGS